MEGTATIRRVKRAEWKPTKPKMEFGLFGTVVKISTKTNSILVEKGGSTTNFWLSCYNGVSQFQEGCKYKFTVKFGSYISKKDSTYTTQINVDHATLLDPEDSVEDGFITGHMPAKILSSTKTEIPGLYILTAARMKDGEEMEQYHFRYFNKERIHPDLGTAIIRFTINKTKDLVEANGEVFHDIETRTIINSDGEEVTVESTLYKPCLSVLSIERG